MSNSIIEAQQEYFEFYALPNGIPLLLFPPLPQTARELWDSKIRKETTLETTVVLRRFREQFRPRPLPARLYGANLKDAFPRWYVGMGHGPP